MLKTWDIFDTLIARRCVFPQSIFQIVEQVSKVGGFVQARIAAERNVSMRGKGYSFDDIYDELQRITNAPKNICDNLKKLEYDIEFEQSIPITENICQVKAGDVLISDMYLPENFIRRLLDKAGLLAPVEIVITNNGKSSGRIWKQLADQKEFVFHIGDNQNADIRNPRLVGFESALTILSNPTSIEQYLLQKDFNFGAYLREIRLRNPFSEEIKRIYWQLFTINIGILILLVQQIDSLQKKYGFEYLVFAGRDTYYLRLLYEKYKRERGETPTPNDYLYYSRKLVRNSGKEMAKYFAAKINNRKALIMDLYGTGAHLNNLRENFGLNFSILICLKLDVKVTQILYPNMLFIENWISALDSKYDDTLNKEKIFILQEKGKFKFSDAIEPLNRATHNSPVRLKTVQIDEKIFPKVIFSESNDTENFDVFEQCFSEVLRSKIISSTYAANEAAKFEELLLPLISVLNNSSVSLPLRGQHQLAEQVDRIENMVAQRK